MLYVYKLLLKVNSFFKKKNSIAKKDEIMTIRVGLTNKSGIGCHYGTTLLAGSMSNTVIIDFEMS